mmetsp:Transcript_42893/g.52109  ORF Transcript_42893/g.52109 Transcript_42893/m.52109 type:complete len:106 (-) Transcript_42893:348-665(-)
MTEVVKTLLIHRIAITTLSRIVPCDNGLTAIGGHSDQCRRLQEMNDPERRFWRWNKFRSSAIPRPIALVVKCRFFYLMSNGGRDHPLNGPTTIVAGVAVVLGMRD